MPQSENQRLQIITWSVVLFLLAISAIGYGGNGDDAYWHIKVGEWILAHHQVPTTGIFSYSNSDKTWVSHEWLSAVLLYKVFQYKSWGGLIFLTLLSLFISVQLLLFFLLKRLNTIPSLIFVLFAYLLIIPHILPRPHIFAIPIMLYWTICLVECSEKQSKPPFYILPLMVLWVNMHGSFAIGVVFSVFFAAEAIFYATSEVRKTLTFQWLTFILAALICTTLTPHGIDGVLLPFQLSSQNYALSRISEWVSPNFHNYQPLELWLLSFLALTLTLGIKLPIFRLIFLLGLLHLSLKHARHACDLLSVLSPIILATPLAIHWRSLPDMSFNELWPKTYKGTALLVVYFLSLFFYLVNIKVSESQQNQQIQKVLLALKPEQQQLGNVLNNYGIADFLIHLDYQVFIDPRAELYGDQFIKNYFDAIELTKNSQKLENIIHKHHVTWTIFYTFQSINTYLATQTQWHMLYTDKIITLYVHQSVQLSKNTLNKLSLLKKQTL
jgi:hypothetical protein